MKGKIKAAVVAAFVLTAVLGGCSTSPPRTADILPPYQSSEEPEAPPPEEITGGETGENGDDDNNGNNNNNGGEHGVEQPEQPKIKTVSYICVTTDGVNIRSGAGTGNTVRGAAEKSTLYALAGSSGKWYKTGYKNADGYIHSDYCKTVEMRRSDKETVESIISEGTKLLGTKYVYGAVRYHDGSGRRLAGFTVTEFDCSSLMQYIFKKGAGVNLQVNTRTQVYQGTTVKKSELARGDLMFFTNASRKNNTGVERIGHVALYLGDNYILHTASDYAKIEQISSLRWSYFIQAQRII